MFQDKKKNYKDPKFPPFWNAGVPALKNRHTCPADGPSHTCTRRHAREGSGPPCSCVSRKLEAVQVSAKKRNDRETAAHSHEEHRPREDE